MADQDEWKFESGLRGTTWKFKAKDNRVKEEQEEEGQEQDEEGDDREVQGAFEASPDLLFSHSATLPGQPPCACLVDALRKTGEGAEGGEGAEIVQGDDEEVKGAFEASPDELFCHYATLPGQPPCACLVAALRKAREGAEGGEGAESVQGAESVEGQHSTVHKFDK